ncbi:MAG TPA: hypothetical protein VGL20_09100 [Candidatus Dormibacteraeota bacterium]
MRSCRQIALEDIGGSDRRFLVDGSAGPAVLRQLTDPDVAREPLPRGSFLWVDVATSPGAAVLLGADGDSPRGAVATRVDLDALGGGPRSGVVRLRPGAEHWLRCCGAGVDACLAYTRRRCSLAFEHLIDADELLAVPPIAATYEPGLPAGRPFTLDGERCELLHCSGLVLAAGQVWSLWADPRGAPRSWERHPDGDGIGASVRTPRYARRGRGGHLTWDGVEVDLRLPFAAELERLCAGLAYGMRVLEV